MATVLIKTVVWGGPPAYEENYNGKCDCDKLVELLELNIAGNDEDDDLGEFLEEACQFAGQTTWYMLDETGSYSSSNKSAGMADAVEMLKSGKLFETGDDCQLIVFGTLIAEDGETNEEAHARISAELSKMLRDALAEMDDGSGGDDGDEYDENDW